MKTSTLLALCTTLLTLPLHAALDGAKIEAATGLKGTMNEAEGVFKVSAPRGDVKVSVDGWTMPPFMGLTSWAAFLPGKKEEAMVMGDLVLFQDEVNPVMSAALGAGLSVTALHNHFFYDEPKVYFMHIGGEGSVEKLGAGVKTALDKMKEIRAANPTPGKVFGEAFAPASNSITAAPLETAFGGKATVKDGMAKFVFGRASKMPCGCEVGKEMGVNTWAAFAGTDDNAIVDGDFCVLEKELQPVLRTLRENGVNVVAIHHHMAMEEPKYLFLHYWGKGKAADLAKAVKAAMATQGKIARSNRSGAGHGKSKRRLQPEATMRLARTFLVSFLLSPCFAVFCGHAAEPKVTKAIALPGVEGRFDHAAVDVVSHRLFFAALGNDTLEVVDVEAGKRLHTIPGLKKPTGVAFLARLNLLVVANGSDGTCRFFDGTTYAEHGRVTGLDDADNLRFDAKEKRVYLGYGDGALASIDPEAMKVVATIPLAKHPESFQLEENGPRIFVNVPDARQIAVVDRRAGRVTATWPVEDARANFPMALAEKEGRVFVACRQPARLLAFDLGSGKRVGEAAMSGDADDLFFDAPAGELMASCGEGFLDVFRFAPPGTITRTYRVASAAGARTAFFSAKLGALFLAVPHRGSQGAEIRVYEMR